MARTEVNGIPSCSRQLSSSPVRQVTLVQQQMATESCLVFLLTVPQRIVQMDLAPARIENLRCGGRRSNRCSHRCLPVQVEVAAQAARRLERQASTLLLEMQAVMLLESLLGKIQH